MKALVYLVCTEAKNGLKELLRKPVKLILYLFILFAVIGMMILPIFTGQYGNARAPMFWLRGIYFAFVALFLVTTVQKGLTSGDAIFDMSDVNLLFVSPVNPRSTLLYGLVRLVKVSFLAGFFILFQGSNLANFGVDIGGLLLLYFIFIACMVSLSVLSLVIYSTTNSRPRRKLLVRVLLVLVFVPLVAYFLVQLAIGADVMTALGQAIDSIWLAAIPFAGWAAAGAVALLQGKLLAGCLWLALMVFACAAMILYIMRSRADYYEDVLVATETAYERKRATEEGDIQAVSAANAKVRVTKTGVGGMGASAIFYKHLRETFRQNRLGFFSLYTIIMAVCLIGASIFLRGSETQGLDIVLFLQILMWMQIFMIGNGRGLRELYTHYIYMIPEPAFKKVVWSNLELVFKTLLESIFFLAIPGLILGDHPLVVIGSMLVYTLFSVMLLGINYLSMRWTATSISQGILLTIYFFAVFLLIAPGLAGALIVGFIVGGVTGTALGLGILALWELAIGLLCFALSRSILHNCDMPSAKPTGK